MPTVLSKQMFFSSQLSGIQSASGVAPVFLPQLGGANYHFWLEHKTTGKVWDRTPMPDPLKLNGKIVRYYEPYDTEKTLSTLKEVKETLDELGDLGKAFVLSKHKKTPEPFRCFQNSYSVWSLDKEVRDNYYLRCGAFGYETNDPEMLGFINKGKGFKFPYKRIISLDYGY